MKTILQLLDAGTLTANRGTTETETEIEHASWIQGDRYAFDFDLCSHRDGWTQYDTDQDAWYFGVWVHVERRIVVSYCEGDITITEYKTLDAFRAALDAMAAFYGAPPPAVTVIDADGTLTHYTDAAARPQV